MLLTPSFLTTKWNLRCLKTFIVFELPNIPSFQVATFAYISNHTNIPVPTIYTWCSDANTEVGAEYMIMEKVWI